ncbi:bifunctional phosphopantothenoylcysteine decarboxylase/phosphopantothenate--cysteine ligase CoaBC [Acidipila sp. EB88]|uniref:bifunctional phosphopantothenoylcysteine decarboxylase/phosphopantothenate--cysteine ligase CoaBC n=1 Tax=Acidipila sp. EB88 TaxID=2305226 RepID=UPI000F5D78CF|nr:bifunctional phosphopantothenoylcysteine decarboxylase/phosphopantothenate--cysteine ligase CoaBC [Acidipila sp. EB88]RRA49227.1 bifunctional phosphopantothenoylcysteine decarboxylase/phosphopantothenate--cysteine ligase CoaBC [Acidipila sp. EB88]
MKITLAVTGGIAAYKAVELLRALQTKALDVQVVMTEGAQRFVQPLTFAALSGHRVITGLWDEQILDEASGATPAMEHIALAQSTEALVIAPASADSLARLAQGRVDDFLGSLYLATLAPVIIAPAMNVRMWEHPATQANIALLEARGATIVAPNNGALACGMQGTGRLAEPSAIVEAVLGVLHHSEDLAGETVLITAGGTREAVDPVRFLGNRSSGKMGYSLAEAARRRGARVILVSAPTALRAPIGCEVVPVITADQMRDAVFARLPGTTMVIMSAAVADYKPRAIAEQKLRRSGPLTLELEPTEDILAAIVQRREPGMLVIGFAAETQDVFASGRAKLMRKGVDAIVLNDVSREGIGFDSDSNAATFLTASTAADLPEMSKRALADRILGEVMQLRRPQRLMAETGSHTPSILPTRP